MKTNSFENTGHGIIKYFMLLVCVLVFFHGVSYSQLVNDFRVNDDTTTYLQKEALVGAADNGNFVVLWSDNRTGIFDYWQNYFQRYNASGKPIGHNVLVETQSRSYSHALNVRNDGSFIVAWTDTSICYVRIYDSTGSAVRTVIATDSLARIKFLTSLDISVCSFKNGNFIVTMDYRPNVGYDPTTLYFQRFDKYGNKIDSNIAVNDITLQYPSTNPSITSRNDGSFIIVWEGSTYTNPPRDIYMQMYDSIGHKIGINRRVNDSINTINIQCNPSVSADSSGSFVAVWQDQRLASGTMYSTWAQAFNPNGSLNGVNFEADTPFGVDKMKPKVRKRKDGYYIVGWYYFPSDERYRRPQCQRFNNLNQKIGSDFDISRTAIDSCAKYFEDFAFAGDKIISVWSDTRNGGIQSADVYCNILSFANPDSTVGVRNISGVIPGEYKLYQNYPNPFNPVTTIQYSIPKESRVAIRVYDITGKEVRVLVNEIQKSGYYSVRFDGFELASGIYFYKIHAGNFTQTKRMVLVK
ncbi:MAG TPA: T9SS type A sorting domain-containing protein [Ignavibacteria bacterium]|nr:T9SS type A sorting domain-containing protein [Ignavibacteria bacterium]